MVLTVRSKSSSLKRVKDGRASIWFQAPHLPLDQPLPEAARSYSHALRLRAGARSKLAIAPRGQFSFYTGSDISLWTP